MRCQDCGQEHELLDPAFRRPEAIVAVPADEQGERTRQSDDMCSMQEEDGARRYFVRCVMPVRIVDGEDGAALLWGMWAEVDEPAMKKIHALWSAQDQDKEPPFAATLANRVMGYPETLGLPGKVQLTGAESRPTFVLDGALDHPFAEECRAGVTAHRAHAWTGLFSPVRAFACSHVARGEAPLLTVAHDEDGDWLFLCGGEHGEDEEPAVVDRNTMLGGEPSLGPLFDLDVGEEAVRTAVGAPWERRHAEA